MSYILDALRKSDQQRQRGAAPRLLAARASAAAPKRPAAWAYGLFGIVLLGAGIAIGWLRPWQAEPPAAEPLAAQRLEPRPAQVAPVAKAGKQIPAIRSRPSAAPAQAPARAAEKPQAVATAEPKTGAREIAKQAPREEPKPAVEKGAGAAPPPAEQKVVALADLPLAIQQELPNMAISVHAYSGNPKERLVGINNRMLREGDFVQPGLGLEQITPDGMIFSYKGYRFVRGVR